MPISPNTINLIATKTGLSPRLELIENSLQRASTVGVVMFLGAGLLVGALYFYYFSSLSALEKTQTQLRSQINAAKANEGLLTSIKDRTRTVELAMNSQRQWAQTLDLLGTVAVPPALSAVSVDEENKIEITVQARVIDDLLAPVSTLMAYANEGRLRNTELRSVQFDKNGLVTMTVTFHTGF